MRSPEKPVQLLDVCLLAGKLMLQNGAETYRVEDTMSRMAKAVGADAHSYVTPTVVLISLHDGTETKLVRVTDRTIDLQKVTEVNALSRRFCDGELTLEDAEAGLERLQAAPHAYRFLFQVLAAALASGCFLVMFGGKWLDFLDAAVCGAAGFALVGYFHRLIRVKFFAEFLGSTAIGILGFLATYLGLGTNEDTIIIASVMPLVPGLLITNAIRDLMAGHLVSGISKGGEALLTAAAIGGGIAATLAML